MIFSSNSFAIYPLLFFILFSSVQVSWAYVFTGYQIRDLNRNDACFSIDAANWTASNLVPTRSIYSRCDNNYMLGGSDVLGTNSGQMDDYYTITYTNLPPHTMIYFSFAMWAIDSWNPNQDYFIVELDTKSFISWGNFDYQNNFINGISCGSNQDDIGDIKVLGRANHSSSTVTFKIISKMDQDSNNEAFGIRDLTLLFASPSVAPTENMCGRASIPIEPAKQCPCAYGSYLNPPSTCTLCDPSCESCFGVGPSQCYSCRKGYSFDGISCVTCDHACTSCYGPSNSQCKSCQSGYLLFQNNTCIPAADCPAPLLQTGCTSYCETPCSNSNDFLYWNGSCSSNCLLPLQQSTVLGIVKLCSFPCNSGEYLYWDGTCSTSCTLPLISRIEAGNHYCDYPCLTTEYLYWNGTCASSCSLPLATGTTGGRLLCYYPCSNSEYLYWDGSCNAGCNTPLVQKTAGGKKYCEYPCLPGQFLTWHGVCTLTCSYPYIQKTQWSKTFCEHPCTGSDFLYWDGTCSSTCSLPLVQSTLGSKRFCNSPCTSSQYLYLNGSCLSSCNSPLVYTFIASANFCKYPCNTGEFLYSNGSCINTCKLPFLVKQEDGKDFCVGACPRGQELFWNGTCISSCKAPLRFSTNSSGTFCNRPCNNPSEFYLEELDQCSTLCNTSVIFQGGLYMRCLVPDPPMKGFELMKLLHYIRYLKVSYPPKLQYLIVNRRMNVLSMTVFPETIESAKKKVLSDAILSKVDKYTIPASFLANFLEDLTLMVIILGCGILFDILEKISKAYEWFYGAYFFERLKVLAKWNLFIVLLISNGGDIIFFSYIQFKSFKASSVLASVSLIVCLIMLLAVILLLLGNIFLIYKVQDFKAKALKSQTNDCYSDYLLEWQAFQVLFQGLKDNKSLTQSFFFIYGLRLVFPMAIATFLSVPLLQASLYVLISLLIIVFLFYQKPIKKKVDLINLIILETFILVVNLCILMLAIFDLCKIEMYGAHIFFGDVIIAMNYCIDFLGAIFLPIKIIDGIHHAYFLRKKGSNEVLGAWAQLLFLPLQQGGLGFEKVQLVTRFTISRIKSTHDSRKRIASSLHTIEPISISRSKSPKTTASSTNIAPFRPISVNQEIRIDGLNVPELPKSQIHKYKKRKVESPHPEQNTEHDDVSLAAIEGMNDGDDTLITRLKNLSKVGLEGSRTDQEVRKRDFYPNSQSHISGDMLDLSQVSQFNAQNMSSYDLKRTSRSNKNSEIMF